MSPKKYSFPYVKEHLETEYGITILSTPQEYGDGGSKTKIRWKCQSGKHKKSTTVASIIASEGRCKKCTWTINGSGTTYQDFVDMLNLEDWIVISPASAYENDKSVMTVICLCGNKVTTTYNRFGQGHRCKCHANYELRKRDIDEVRSLFADKGWTLLETEYINNSISLRARCPNRDHPETKISLGNFLRNKTGCRLCSDLHRSELMPQTMKKAFKYKTYVFPSGRTCQIQGYENKCLDRLLDTGFREEDIIVGHTVPVIVYTDPETYREHKYYPDIWIPSQNKLIEVKSTWTYHRNEVKNEAKFIAAFLAGYDMEVWVYDGRLLVNKWSYEYSEVGCPGKMKFHSWCTNKCTPKSLKWVDPNTESKSNQSRTWNAP